MFDPADGTDPASPISDSKFDPGDSTDPVSPISDSKFDPGDSTDPASPITDTKLCSGNVITMYRLVLLNCWSRPLCGWCTIY